MRFSPLLAPCSAVLVLLGACAVEPFSQGANRGTRSFALSSVADFGSNPGGLTMYAHLPAGMPARAPLVVAMHGCMMSASDYENAGWNELADQWKFYVVYPETSGNMGCFAWFDPSHSGRGGGQALSIKQMVDYMLSHYDVDPGQLYVTGLSAGGAMSATMLAAYPDLFAAGAPMAGLPYRCADSLFDSGACLSPGRSKTAEAWGELVRGAFPGYAGPYPRLSIWQGALDSTVSTTNATELVKQWTNVHGIDAVADASGHEETATRTQYRDAAGRTLVETWMVDSMGHGTAVRPGWAPANGCGQAGNFVLSAGICSTYHAARFFGLEPAASATDAGTPLPEADGGEGVTPSEDAGPAQPGTDAGTSTEAADAGAAKPDAGAAKPDTGETDGSGAGAGSSGCGIPGVPLPSLAPLGLLLLLRRRSR